MTYMCGMRGIDENTRGLKAGDVTLIAGSAGGCKTNMLINMAKGFQEKNASVLFLTLESNSQAVQTRFICRGIGLKQEDILDKAMTDDTRRRIKEYGASACSRVSIGSASWRSTPKEIISFLAIRAELKSFNVLMLDSIDLIGQGSEEQSSAADTIRSLRILGSEHGFTTIASTSLKRGAIDRLKMKSSIYKALDVDDIGCPGLANDADNIFIIRPGMDDNGYNSKVALVPAKLRYSALPGTIMIMRSIPEKFWLEETMDLETFAEKKAKEQALPKATFGEDGSIHVIRNP